MVMPRLGGLGGLLGVRRPAAKITPMGFKMLLNVTDGDAAYDTPAKVAAIIHAATALVWTRIWEKTVPAQQAFRWGYGNANQPRNQGYMWFASMDSGTDWTVGVLRLIQENARGTLRYVVAEIPDSQLHASIAAGAGVVMTAAALIDQNQMLALPEKIEFPLVGEDSKLALDYKTITAATTADECDFSLPVTAYQ